MRDHSKSLVTIQLLVEKEIIPNLSKLYTNKTIIIDEPDCFMFIDDIEMIKHKPNKGELRLGLDIINQMYPLYKKCDTKSKKEFLEDIFKFDLSIEKIDNLKSFKKIVKKQLLSTKLVEGNTTIKTTKIIRRRRNKNISNLKKYSSLNLIKIKDKNVIGSKLKYIKKS